ncbi:hypothetical protein FJY71_02740 [candidate division WOR-3 bacterium]|nr:hypothetical protein [candidate division WOR-3 bacterium]
MTRIRSGLIAAAALSLAHAAPAPEVVWHRTFDTGRCDYWPSGAVDPWGNAILAGWTADDAVGTNAVITILKYNPDGETVWTRTYDSSGVDEVYGCAVGPDGRVVVAGRYYPTSGSQLIKYDRDGNLLWARRERIGAHGYFTGVAVDESLDIYVTGSSDIGGDYYWFIRKYRADSTLLWSREYDPDNREDLFDLALAPDGSLVGSGSVERTGWHFDFFAAKLKRDGDTVWTRWLDIKNEDWGDGVSAGPTGEVYVAGGACEYLNGFIVPESCVTIKYDRDGNLEWSRVLGADDCTDGYGIALDSPGRLLVAGLTYDTLVDTANALFLSYKPDGTLEWSWLWRPQPRSCILMDLVAVSPGVFYAFGYVYSPGQYDRDFLVMKLRCPTGVEEQPPSAARPSPTATVCRGVLSLPPSPFALRTSLFSPAGRKVAELRPGRNDVRHLSPGAYFVRSGTGPVSRVLLVE